MNLLVRFAVGALPVAAFLLALVALDSYKLMSVRRVLYTVAAGGVVALICYCINRPFFEVLGANDQYWAWFGAPPVEEILKAAIVVQAVRRARVGFLVDAAICGFAVGAGFALVENLYYAQAVEADIFTFVVRGFGTAMMHGGTTAIVGMLARRAATPVAGALWGLAVAVSIHVAYNLSLLPPVAAAGVLLLGLPALLAVVFARSESGLRNWLGEGFDSEMELLEMVTGGHFLDSRAGAYLQSLKAHFARGVVADMLCLLQMSLELSLRAKGDLLAREAGLTPAPDPAVAEKFHELEYLEKTVGRTGRLALAPLLGGGDRGAWQIRMLREQAGTMAHKV
jgi:RsiW-degrading membrane proteinase PrsW (M82 family)